MRCGHRRSSSLLLDTLGLTRGGQRGQIMPSSECFPNGFFLCFSSPLFFFLSFFLSFYSLLISHSFKLGLSFLYSTETIHIPPPVCKQQKAISVWSCVVLKKHLSVSLRSAPHGFIYSQTALLAQQINTPVAKPYPHTPEAINKHGAIFLGSFQQYY